MYDPKRIALAVVCWILAAGPTSATEAVSELDRFKLWNDCRPMSLLVVGNGPDTAAATIEAVEIAVRSRLRAARLYSADEAGLLPLLVVNVDTFNIAYGIDLDYQKFVTDFATKLTGTKPSWSIAVIGVNSGDASYIMTRAQELADRFIDEYLRVNADACPSL